MESPERSPDSFDDFETWVIQTRLSQGLPARVEDLAVIARIVELIYPHPLQGQEGEPEDL